MASNWSTPPGTPSPTVVTSPADKPKLRDTIELIRPPVTLLLGACVCFLGCVALFRSSSLSIDFVGWVLGGMGVMSFVIAFRSIDQKRREQPNYSPVSWYEYLAVALIIAGFIASLGHVWLFATEYAK